MIENLTERIAQLEKEKARLKKDYEKAIEHCADVNTKNSILEKENQYLQNTLSQIQKDLLLYIQLNGELAQENLRLHEKLKEYQSEVNHD